MTANNTQRANGIMVEVVTGLQLWLSDERKEITLLMEQARRVHEKLIEKKKQEIASDSMKIGEYYMD
jgi:hypothetical protein